MFTGRAFHHGDHVCALFSNVQEQETVAAQFIAAGLRAGERCLFVGSSSVALQRFGDRLQADGVDAAAEQDRGALLLLTTQQAHLIDGCFDSERMLTMLNQAVEDALNDGFAGLRTCGDMTWLLDNSPGSHQVVEYEALITELFRKARALAMCQYDRSRLPAEILDYSLATHGTVVIDGAHVQNPFAEPGVAVARHSARPDRVPSRIAQLHVRAAEATDASASDSH